MRDCDCCFRLSAGRTLKEGNEQARGTMEEEEEEEEEEEKDKGG